MMNKEIAHIVENLITELECRQGDVDEAIVSGLGGHPDVSKAYDVITEHLGKLVGDMDRVSQCRECRCMTHTIHLLQCGKCGKAKNVDYSKEE